MNEGALHEIPGGWVWTRLGELIEPSNERADPLKIEKMPYIGLEHIEKDTGKLLIYGDSNEVKSTKTRFHNGDLLYGKLRPYLNKVIVVDFDGVCSTDILVFSKNSYISNKYIANRFLCRDFVMYANQNVSGVQHPRVNFNILSQFPIPLPPFPEQRAMVSKIEQLFSDLDNGIENFKKAQAQLKLYRQSVLKAACEGKLVPTEAELARVVGRDYEHADVLLTRILNERRAAWENNGKGSKYKEPVVPDTSGLPALPEGWIWTYLDIISLKITDGEHIRPRVTTIGIPFLSAKDVRDDGIIFDDSLYISEEDAKKFRNRCDPEYGDILIVSRGATIGRSCTVNIDKIFCLLGSVILIKLYSMALNKFVSYSIKSVDIQKQLVVLSGSTAQQAIYIRDIRKIKLPLPPHSEQRRIVAEVERRLSVSDKMEATITESLQKAESLRQSILKKAFEGKLLNKKELEKARNAPDWEPAEKLLERINAEKMKIKTKNKDKK